MVCLEVAFPAFECFHLLFGTGCMVSSPRSMFLFSMTDLVKPGAE